MKDQDRNSPTAIHPGDILEVTIEKIVYGGEGLARHGPMVILVPFTAPGERVRVRILSMSKRLFRGEVVELLTRSERRVPPRCRHFGRCGGCQLQHLDDQIQAQIKSDFIRESLRRLGAIDWKGEIGIITGPGTGYRTRAELKVVRDQHDQPHLGYFEAGTHNLCEIESCPILHPAAERELRHLREAPERTARSASRIFIVVGDDQSLAIQATGEDGKRAATDALGTVRQRVRGIDYHFGARSFFQSNRLLIDSFVAKVVGDAAGQSAVDLYAGVGLFSLQLAGHFARVCAVEGDPVAVRHGIQNREINGIANVEYHSLSVEAWLKHHGHEWRQSDLLLLDPPRAGAGVRVCQSIVALAPRQVRYVSCNPTTLARDLRTLVDGGYSISAITLIDMFPQTFHVEAVVTLLPDRNEKIG